MHDPNAERHVENVALGNLVKTLPPHFHLGEAGEILTRTAERTIVHIDRDPARSAVTHRPIGIAANATSPVKKSLAAPELPVLRRPAQELLFMRGQQFGVAIPGIAEAVRRPLSQLRHFKNFGSHRKTPVYSPGVKRPVLFCPSRLKTAVWGPAALDSRKTQNR